MARYLPNLNGLRAIAVLVVLLGHATSLQYEFGGYFNREWLWVSGKFGVVLFFCLSGFLITYLIDTEIKATGGLNIRNFYIKRAARIWPLYFAIAIPALLLNVSLRDTSLHQTMTLNDYVLILLILPGYADRPLFMGQTWSIAIEESFYLVFPFLADNLSKSVLVFTLIGIVFAPELLEMTSPVTCHFMPCQKLIAAYYWAPTFYGTIAIGCLTYLAYSLNNQRINSFLFSAQIQSAALVAISAIITSAIFAGKEQYFDFRWVAFAFSILILNAAFNENTILQLENRPMRYLGEISYGMYMYHVYAICISLMICWIFFKGTTFPYQNLIVSTLSLAITIILAKISFDYFESPVRNAARAMTETTVSNERGVQSTPL